jgi:RNA polymerase sigma-70 factor (ECF subfamily)
MFLDDRQLIEKIINQEDRAFEQLMKKYLKPVYNFLYQLVRDISVADDLTQESFLKAWKNIKKFDKERNFKTWIFTIAKNTAYDYLRKKKSIPFSFFKKNDDKENILENIKAEEILPDEILEREDLARELEEKIGKLPRKYRSILFLHYKEDFSLQEISEIIQKPYNTVKSLHYRALLRLRKEFLTK